MSLCIIGQEKSETNLKLLTEAKKRFNSVLFVPIESVGIGLSRDFRISYRSTDIQRFKAVLPRIPRELSSYGYQLLSLFPGDTYIAIRPISFLIAAERFFMLTVLRKRGIRTIDLSMARSMQPASRVLDSGRFPLVIRTPEKSTGVVVRNRIEAKSVIDALAHLKQPILIEEVCREMVSAYVASPEVVAAVRKKSGGSDALFSQGEIKSARLNHEEEQLALNTASSLEAHIARIDMIPGSDPRVVNVELRPSLIEPSRATGVNIPGAMVTSVRENYRSHTEKPVLIKFFEDAKSVVRDVLRSRSMI